MDMNTKAFIFYKHFLFFVSFNSFFIAFIVIDIAPIFQRSSLNFLLSFFHIKSASASAVFYYHYSKHTKISKALRKCNTKKERKKKKYNRIKEAQEEVETNC